MSVGRQDLEEFRRLLEDGSVRRAYRGLVSFMMGLRTEFQKAHPEVTVSGLYQGYMDMTYFALFPPSLKRRDLKAPIVFNYGEFRFEVWLSAKNRRVQERYREILGTGVWPSGDRAPAGGPGVDSILERDLAPGLALDDPKALADTIKSGALAFVHEIEAFLDGRDPTGGR